MASMSTVASIAYNDGVYPTQVWDYSVMAIGGEYYSVCSVFNYIEGQPDVIVTSELCQSAEHALIYTKECAFGQFDGMRDYLIECGVLGCYVRISDVDEDD